MSVGLGIILVALSLLAGIAATASLLRIRHRQEMEMMQARLLQAEALRARIQRLRHDLRGALSPVMLTGDRLTMNQDPSIKRAGEIILAAVDRCSELLEETRREVPPAVAQPHANSVPESSQG